jgi:hypothetical protein
MKWIIILIINLKLNDKLLINKINLIIMFLELINYLNAKDEYSRSIAQGLRGLAK